MITKRPITAKINIPDQGRIIMRIMKKLFSVLSALCFAVAGTCVSANSASLSQSKEALRSQFEYGCGPRIGLYSIDYRYYSPESDNSSEKYPLVIWVHGHSHGQYEGYQIKSNDIANWSSDEFQSRTENGFYIMAVRAPENLGISWSDDMLSPLKAAIDDFINGNSVDTTKIYIGGFSLGGMMSFKMAINFPDMFAAIFPVCPYITITNDDARAFSDVPVWLVAGENDPLVSYKNRVLKNWTAIISTTNATTECRFSTLSKVCLPDGTSAPTQHYSWEAVTYDMFNTENGNYPYMSTIDGNGETVQLSYPYGMISWLMQHSSEYNPDTDNNEYKTQINIFNVIKAPFMAIYILLRNFFRPLFG